jgi:hypothetical protein
MWSPDNQGVPYDPENPVEKRRRLAWSVAMSCCLETGKNPVTIYDQLLIKLEAQASQGLESSDESDETV